MTTATWPPWRAIRVPPEPVDLLAARTGRLLDASPRRPVLVGVDGRSGSGKTDLARELLTRLTADGTAARTVHLDDLYPGWDGLAAGLVVLCDEVLRPLRSGRPAVYRSWDWHAGRPGPVVTVPPGDVVVVEGVGALACSCARLLDLRVWLDAPVDVRRARALGRPDATPPTWWASWAAQEDALLARSGRPPADVVVDTVTGRARWARLDP